MKRILSIALLLISIQMKAQVTYCNLELFSFGGEKFVAYLNGVQQNKIPTNKVRAEGLSTDVLQVKIVFADQSLGSINKTLYLKMGNEERHVIKRKDAQSKIDEVGDELDNKILGLLGVNQNEKGNSNYVIRFDNSYPIQPKTIVKVKKDVKIDSKKGTYHSKTEAEIETK